MIRYVLLLCVVLSTLLAAAQNMVVPGYSSERVKMLAQAIARTEGFGVRGAIPTRYHNPGDLVAVRGIRFPGQVGVGKGKHAIFKTDADGWFALHRQIQFIIAGQSKYYRLDMTIADMSKLYAKRHGLWALRVSQILKVPVRTTLRQYLTGGEIDTAPVLSYPVRVPDFYWIPPVEPTFAN